MLTSAAAAAAAAQRRRRRRRRLKRLKRLQREGAAGGCGPRLCDPVQHDADLLSEMSRHQWGLCSAREGDVPLTTPISAAAAPSEHLSAKSVPGTLGTELEASSEEMIGEAEEGGEAQATDRTKVRAVAQVLWRTRRPAFTPSMLTDSTLERSEARAFAEYSRQ